MTPTQNSILDVIGLAFTILMAMGAMQMMTTEKKPQYIVLVVLALLTCVALLSNCATAPVVSQTRATTCEVILAAFCDKADACDIIPSRECFAHLHPQCRDVGTITEEAAYRCIIALGDMVCADSVPTECEGIASPRGETS